MFCRCIWLFEQVYQKTPSADLAKVEFLKKTVLDLLNSTLYNNPENTLYVDGLYHILGSLHAHSNADAVNTGGESNTSGLAPVESVEHMSMLLPAKAAVEVVDCLRKQLMEDVAMLRRISRVEDHCGIDCKAILQSGMHTFIGYTFFIFMGFY